MGPAHRGGFRLVPRSTPSGPDRANPQVAGVEVLLIVRPKIQRRSTRAGPHRRTVPHVVVAPRDFFLLGHFSHCFHAAFASDHRHALGRGRARSARSALGAPTPLATILKNECRWRSVRSYDVEPISPFPLVVRRVTRESPDGGQKWWEPQEKSRSPMVHPRVSVLTSGSALPQFEEGKKGEL